MRAAHGSCVVPSGVRGRANGRSRRPEGTMIHLHWVAVVPICRSGRVCPAPDDTGAGSSGLTGLRGWQHAVTDPGT